jgi:erythromycin esterase
MSEKPGAPAAAALWPELNLGFEQVTGEQPTAWKSETSYEWTAASDRRHSGERSLRIRSNGKGASGAVVASVPADLVRGKHLILRGWIRTDRVTGSAAMFLRVDGGGGAFDNMPYTSITWNVDWTEVTVDVDVPAGGERVVFGALLTGEGTAWFDDLRFELSDRPKAPSIVLEGRVVDAAGKPVSGAEVALIGQSGMQGHLQSDAKGAFHFDAMPGRWGFSAHHAGAVGTFLDRWPVERGARAIQLTLGASNGVVVHGTIGPSKPAPNAYVQLSINSMHDGDAFAVPVAADGTFEATLPRGEQYVARVIEGGVGAGSAKRTGDRAEIVIDMPVLVPPPHEVVDWIGAQAIPLATAEAGNGLDDIAPIARLIGKARVVGLGDATYGAREFFQLGHRVLEYLVAREGFTVVAIEANQHEWRAINEYVLHGTGDIRTALRGIYWMWSTEEVLAIIEWIRAWNADPHHAKKVQFVGFDMQASRIAHATVAAFLRRVEPEAAAALLAPIDVFGREDSSAAIARRTTDNQKQLTDRLAAIEKQFDAARETWAHKASSAEIEEVRHDLTILQQAAELSIAGNVGTGFDVRERSMAANIRWILGRQAPGTRMLVWGHNGCIANNLGADRAAWVNMGSHLRRQLEDDYVSIGFVFSQGSFQAMQNRELKEITLGAPPEPNASVVFSRTGKPLLVVDLRTLPPRGIVHDWFAAPHPVRDAGLGFFSEQDMTVSQILPVLYDAVIFVERTTRARPLHR